jgi:hypothetical protein
MKLRLTWALAFLLVIGGCSKKQETPATASEPTAAPASEPAAAQPADQTAAAQPPATALQPATSQAGPAAAVAPEPAPKPVAVAPKPPEPVVIPAGTTIAIRTGQALGSDKSQTGDTFTATVMDPIEINGKVVVPQGADATGKVVEAKKKGKIKGEARLQLTLTSLNVKGTRYPIQTTMTAETSKGKGKRTAATTAGGAGLGAIIGGIAGGGKGAAIGAAVGGGAGFVGGAFTGNKQIEVPAESALVFKLNAPITLK